MRLRQRAHNSNGNFQETSNQGGGRQKAGNSAGSFSEVPRLFRNCSGNRAGAKSTCLSALRLSLRATCQGADSESARSGHVRGNGCRLEISGRLAFSGNGWVYGSAQKIARKHGFLGS